MLFIGEWVLPFRDEGELSTHAEVCHGWTHHASGLLNGGGGIDHWHGQRVGARIEVRDHFSTNSTLNLIGARFAVVFR